MLLVAHHIAWDDGSWQVFFADLTRAYTGADLGPADRPAPSAVPDDHQSGSRLLAHRDDRSA